MAAVEDQNKRPQKSLFRFIRRGAALVSNGIVGALFGHRKLRGGAVKTVTKNTSSEVQQDVHAGGDLSQVLERAVKKALEGSKERGETFEEVVTSVALGAVKAAAEIGGDLAEEAIVAGNHSIIMAAKGGEEDLSRVTRSTTRAGLNAAARAGVEFQQMAQSLARDAIQSTADVGGDVAAAAQDVVAGAVDAAMDLGVPAEEAACAAATGAIEAAGKIGGDVVKEIHTALAAPIDGVDVVLKGPLLSRG